MLKRNKGVVGFWALVCLAGVTVEARQWPSMEWVEYENALTIEFPTPHTRWAKPYALGSVKVLFFGHKDNQKWMIWGPGTRYAAELIQRFDVEGDAVLVDPEVGPPNPKYPEEPGVYGGELGRRRLSRLLATPFDCFVFGREDLSAHLPDVSRKKILQAVRDGAGLVLYGQIDEALCNGLTALDETPAFLAGLDVDCFTLGKGRVVAFRPRRWNLWHRKPPEIFDLAHIFGVDLAMDLDTQAAGRTLLWASRRAPDLVLSIAAKDPVIRRTELPDNVVEVTWQSNGLTQPLELAVRVRAQGRGLPALPVIAGLNPAEGSHSFSVPLLPAGRYTLDVIARSSRGIEAWATAPMMVASDEQVRHIKLARAWGEAGDLIEGTVEVVSSHRALRTLHVRVIDKHGRVLATQAWRRPGPTVAFSLPTPPLIPNMVAIEAVLADGDEPIDYAYTYEPYTVPDRKHDQWNFIAWGRLYSGGYGALIAEEAMARMGISSRIETTYTPWWFMSRAGMNYTPYCASGLPNGRAMPFRNFSFSLGSRKHCVPKVDSNGVLARADGCLNDEPGASQRIRGYVAAEQDFRSHGVLSYSTGDEKLTFVSCLHPSCWKKYLEYLALQYGSIDTLNASWGTSFDAFHEVEPIIDETAYPDVEDADDRRSVIMGHANNAWSCLFSPPGSTSWDESLRNYPRWFDRRAFQYWNYAQHVDRFRHAVREIDPQGRSGQEGTLFGAEQDVDLIVRHTDWWVLYNDPTLEIVRSIAPSGYTYGKWFGYGNSEENVKQWWWTFLRGSNCQAWWRADHFLNMRAGPGRSRAVVESGKLVIDGLGTLLNMRSRPRHDGIVMLHSFPSAQASYLEAGHSYGTYGERPGATKGDDWPIRPRGNMHVTWHRAIRSLGLQFQYTTHRKMRRGEFRPDDYKVMILSQCEAIGASEAKVIRDFVTRGGTVIADVRPGIYDGHCKPVAPGVLDGLFGVEHRGNVPAREVPGGMIQGRIGDHEVAVDFAVARAGYPEYLAWLHGDLDQLNGSRQASFGSLSEAVPDLHVNPAVTVTTGTALGEAGGTPICIVNEVGRGRAVLLNFSMSTYPEIMIRQTPEACAEFLASLFASAGVQWPLRLLNDEGNRHRNVEAVRWNMGGDLEVMAIYGPLDDRAAMWRHYTPGVARGARVVPLPRHEQVDAVRVRLPRPRHVVEIGGRHRGLVDEITIRPQPRRPVFLVLGNRAMQGPILRAGSPAVPAGQILPFELAIPDSQGMHAVKIRVTTPGGEDATWFARTVVVEERLAKFELAIAHNEQPGTWKMTATDLYTEAVSVAYFVVE